MNELARWFPTLTTAAMVVGIAFVADSSIKRHESLLKELEDKIQELEKKVAVLEAFRQNGGHRDSNDKR